MYSFGEEMVTEPLPLSHKVFVSLSSYLFPLCCNSCDPLC